eukprot:7520-Heterococcus_DN1.PRE.1
MQHPSCILILSCLTSVCLVSFALCCLPCFNVQLLGYLRPLAADINRLRAMRISSEGRVLPPVHFVILGSLAMLLLLGFTLTMIAAERHFVTSVRVTIGFTATVPSSGDATQNLMVAVPQESRVLFTLLVNAFSLLLEFALDLTNPFTGRYKVRTQLLLTAAVLHALNYIFHSHSVNVSVRKTQQGSLHTRVRCCVNATMLAIVCTARTDLLAIALYTVCVTDAAAGEAYYCYSLPHQDQK